MILLTLCNTVFAEERISDFELEIQGPKIIETAPGETANFTANVKNNGNMLENFTIAIDKDNMPEGLEKGWQIDFQPTNFNISAGNEKNITINITSDESSDFGDYEIYINVTSKDNESVPASVDNFTVRISFYKPDIIGDTHLNTNTGNFVIYEDLNLSLKNRGSAKDIISSEIKSVDSPLTANWAGATPEELLESNVSSGNYMLRVRIPEKTPYNTEKDYEIQLYVNSSKDPSKNEIVIITVFIEKYFDVKVTKERFVFVTPGIPVWINFTVDNTGNRDDTYSISMKGDEGINFVSIESPLFFSLGPGNNTFITVKIDPPPEPEQKKWWINITTTSEKSLNEVGYNVGATSHLNVTLGYYYKPRITGAPIGEAETNGTMKQYYTFNIRIRNDGSGSDTIRMAIDKVEPPLNAYWDGPIPWGDTIKAGEVGQEYELKVEIPPNTPHGSYTISIWVNSSNDPSKNYLVNLTLIIEEYYEISVNLLEEIIEVNPDENLEVEFNVNIINNGNMKMDFELKYISGIPIKWTYLPSSSIILKDIEQFEERQKTIEITIDDESLEGLYEDIIYRVSLEDAPTIYKDIELKVLVKEFYKIRLNNPSATAGTVEPVEGKNKVAMAVDVYNDGNVDDDILFSVKTVEFYANYPEAIKWDEIAFYSSESMETKITSIDVNAYDKETVYLGVELPTGVDDRCWVTTGSYIFPIYGESKEDPTANDTEDIEMIIKKVSEVNVEYTGGRKKIDPGETVSFVVKVENYVNEKDEMTFDIIDTYDWSHPVDDFYKTEFDEGEKREIKVNITIPTIEEDDTAEAGNYDISLEVKPKSGGTKQTVRLDFEIMESYGCKIELIDKSKNELLPDEGTVINFKAKVSNLGNSEVNIKVPAIDGATNLSSADFNKWDVFLETATSKGMRELDISIKPTESKEITVKVEIHEGGYINTYSMLLRAYPEGKMQYEAYPQRIWLTLREPIYKLAWTESSKNQDKSVEPENDTEIEYMVYVENLGTKDDTVTVRVEPLTTDLKGWEVKFRPLDGEDSTTLSEIKIGDKEIQIFTLVVRPDERADKDTYEIDLTVESEIDTTVADMLTLKTTVKRPDVVIIPNDITLPQDVKIGDLAQIIVKVNNFGNAKARDVEIIFYEDINCEVEIDNNTITIPAESFTTVTGEWEAREGKYQITIVADNIKTIAQSIEIKKEEQEQPSNTQNSIVIVTSLSDGLIIDKIKKTFTINGTASDEIKVQIKIDDGEWLDTQGTNNWTYKWELLTVKEGNHTISVRSFDGVNYSDVETVNVSVKKEVALKEEEKKNDEGLKVVFVIPIIIIMLVIGIILGNVMFQRKSSLYERPPFQQSEMQQQFQTEKIHQIPEIQLPPKQPPSFSAQQFQTNQEQQFISPTDQLKPRNSNIPLPMWEKPPTPPSPFSQAQKMQQFKTTKISSGFNTESDAEPPLNKIIAKEDVALKQIEVEQVSINAEEMTKTQKETISKEIKKTNTIDNSFIKLKEMKPSDEEEEKPIEKGETVNESDDGDWWKSWEKTMKSKNEIDKDK